MTNVPKSQGTVSTAPPANGPGRPPDVTVPLVTRETDVRNARRTFTEMIVVNILFRHTLLPCFYLTSHRDY